MGRQKTIRTEEFKRETVKLCESSDKTIETIAKELGIGVSTLHGWKAKYGSTPLRRNAANKSNVTETELDLMRMRREVERLKKENEILKKAAAFFARELV